MSSIRQQYQGLYFDQKIAVKVMLLILAVFTVINTIAAVLALRSAGKYELQNASLEMSQSADYTRVYTGEVEGKAARFTVSPDRSVVYQIGDDTYGPFRVEIRQRGDKDSKARAELMLYLKDDLILNCEYDSGMVYADSDIFHPASTAKPAGDEEYGCLADFVFFDVDGIVVDHRSNTLLLPSLGAIIALSRGLHQPQIDLLPMIIYDFVGAFACIDCVICVLFHRRAIRLHSRLWKESRDDRSETWLLDWVLYGGAAIFCFVKGFLSVL